MRLDRAVSRAIAYYLSANSKKTYSTMDFSPYDKQPERLATFDEVVQLLTRASNG